MNAPAAPIDESCVLIDGPWTHRFVSANGSRFHVVEAGTGPMVLFLHGFPEFWWAWQQQLRAVAEAGFRAVAVDMRGYGASDKPPRGYDGYTMAADVTGLIRALGERSADLVGAGYGGMMAWTTAAFHPQDGTPPDRLRRGAPAAPARRRSSPTRAGRRRRPRRCCKFQIPRYEHVLTRDDAALVGEYLRRLGRQPRGSTAPTSPTTSASAAPRCRSRRRRSARWRPTAGRSARCCACTGTASSSCSSSRS